MGKASIAIETMKIKDLKKAEYNPREITSEAKNGLRHSIEKFGYIDTIIFNKRTKTVVSGHQRLDILTEEGYSEVDVSVVDMSLEDEKKLNILMNSTKITGDFTAGINEMLDEISDIDPETFDLGLMGTLYESDTAESKDEKKGKEEGSESKGIGLLPYESYDAVLVVFKRRDDFMFVSSKLGLEEKVVISSPMVKNKKLGQTRAIDGAKLVELLGGEKDEFSL